MNTIAPHDEASLARLKEELAGMTIRALQKRAEELGVDEDKLDDAEEKSDIVEMILATAKEEKWGERIWQVTRQGDSHRGFSRGGPINRMNPSALMVPTNELGGGGTSGEEFRNMFERVYPLRDGGTPVYITVSSCSPATAVWSVRMTVNHQSVELTPGINTENWVTMMMA